VASSAIRLAVFLALVTYPLLVWFGLARFGTAPMAVVLGILLMARLLLLKGRLKRAFPVALVVVGAFIALVVLADDDRLLRFYPVLISSALFGACAWTLVRPPSLLERMLRLAGRDIPAEAPPYLRGVTLAWAVFFVVNAAIAAWTALAAPLQTWVFYNGFLAYVLIAALVGLEWLARPVYRRAVARRERG